MDELIMRVEKALHKLRQGHILILTDHEDREHEGDLVVAADKVSYILRQVELFKNLPAEVLMIIADETDTLSIEPQQVIFLENDPPTDLFIVASGTVHIIRQNVLLAELKENSFFGELALIDNAPRTASAIAKTEGMLLVLHKEIFERIINDLPQLLLSVTQTILRYLRVNLASK